MKTLEVEYMKSSSRIPDWIRKFTMNLKFYHSSTDNEIESLNRISDSLNKFNYKRRNSMCSGAYIKRYIEDNRLYICNTNSEIAQVVIYYKNI